MGFPLLIIYNVGDIHISTLSSGWLNKDGIYKLIAGTINVYRSAAVFLIGCINAEWDSVGPVYKENKNKGQRAAELLIHATKNNPVPKYDFDARFPKFPSYFRRAAISFALGVVSSYRSNYANWEASDKKGKPPVLPEKVTAMPAFFCKNMSESDDMLEGNSSYVKLKLHVKKDWVWVTIPCRRQDAKYLAKWWSSVEPSAPVLEEKRKRKGKAAYCLRYAFEQTCDLTLNDAPLDKRTILAVDLGINTDATCSVIHADGTVTARKFINFPVEKDHLYHILNRIKKKQRRFGRTGGKSDWQIAMQISDELSKKIANAIVEFAVLNGVNVIVFEYLSTGGKIHGSKKQRLHLWRKRAIQEIAEHKAHLNLIRISRICAWNTSKLAFDGSWILVRDPHNHQLATFVNGKQYNCDLSASYNIGARYFLREYCNLNPRLLDQMPKASQRTYADLRSLLDGAKQAA